jgi:N-acylneuraminate cytidylyltransferase/CMP-N,N'-diacetyllegionaminic acid synthase
MKVLAIITARGGSKGIPNKNIKPLGGKPLIIWTVEAALAAEGVDRTILTTDSQVIADAGAAAGAEVPFLRPAELARDDSPSIGAILHAVRWLDENQSYLPEYVLCLQPTTPFRSAWDIDAAIKLAADKKADSVISVTPVEHSPNWMQTIDDTGRLQDYVPGGTSVSIRQELIQVYELNGAIFLTHCQALLEKGSLFVEPYAYIMPRERSIDIDTPWDLYLADLIAKDIGNA